MFSSFLSFLPLPLSFFFLFLFFLSPAPPPLLPSFFVEFDHKSFMWEKCDLKNESQVILVVMALNRNDLCQRPVVFYIRKPSEIRFISFFLFFFKFYFTFKLYTIVLVLPNIEMNPPQVYPRSPSWTLLPPPSPYHPSGSSQCTSPKHPVLCIEPGLATHFIHDIIHVSMLFSHISPPSPSPTESIRLIYTSVSLLLSHTQGYCYHLSKFHIYALVYNHL